MINVFYSGWNMDVVLPRYTIKFMIKADDYLELRHRLKNGVMYFLYNAVPDPSDSGLHIDVSDYPRAGGADYAFTITHPDRQLVRVAVAKLLLTARANVDSA